MNEEFAKKDMIIGVLKRYGCCDAIEIAKYIMQMYKYDISPRSVSGQMRGLKNKAYVGSSKNEKGTQTYWLTEYYKDDKK